MDILLWSATGLLVLGIGGAGAMKLAKNPTAVEASVRMRYEKLLMPIGVVEVLVAIGVVLGAAINRLDWLGLMAGAGVIALMLGAVSYHIRAKDRVEIVPSLVMIVTGALYLVALNGS